MVLSAEPFMLKSWEKHKSVSNTLMIETFAQKKSFLLDKGKIEYKEDLGQV